MRIVGAAASSLTLANEVGGCKKQGRRMDKTIALLNIDHYRKMLVTEHDETKRQTVLLLLAEERLNWLPDHPPNKESMRFV